MITIAKHIVKCSICNLSFDTNEEPWVKTNSRRYAHKACVDKKEEGKSQNEKDYEKLEEYILKLYNRDTLGAKISKQIRDYHRDYNYTFSGIQKSLIWWYEIKGNVVDENLTHNGIGIVPFIYDDAMKYFYSLFLAQLVNDNSDIGKIAIEEIQISPPRVSVKPPRLFNF